MNSLTIETATNPVSDIARMTTALNPLTSSNITSPAKDIDYPVFFAKSAISNAEVNHAEQEYDAVINANPVSISSVSELEEDIARYTKDFDEITHENIVNPAKDADSPVFNAADAILSETSQSKAEYDAIRSLENISITNIIMKAIYGSDRYYNYCTYQ